MYNKIVNVSHLAITGYFLSHHHLEGLDQELKPYAVLVSAVLTD